MEILHHFLGITFILFALLVSMGSNDLIENLPGQPAVKFHQYSGYVKVDENSKTEPFYWFFEAESPGEKPLALWLQGGPGCSSLMGAMLEVGPFRVNDDGKTLFLNPFAWNTVANILFLESPVGVGFSRTTNTSVYNNTVGDQSTAEDSYKFLLNWLDRFPQYKGRDLFLTGESYAGHYVPQLAELIVARNQRTNRTILNLKGISIGNAVLNDATDASGSIDFLWSHSMMSDETHQSIKSKCKFDIGVLTTECESLMTQARKEMGVGYIDIENIYAPLCHDPGLKNGSLGSVLNFDPCSGNYLQAYLNLREVQSALHAKPGTWGRCSLYSWVDSPRTVLPILKSLMSSGVRVWIYNGEYDAIIPTLSTRYSLNILKLPVRTPWYAWYANKEIGGYAIEYQGLMYATVRAASHSVPSNQPERALMLFSSFLRGVLLPPQP